MEVIIANKGEIVIDSKASKEDTINVTNLNLAVCHNDITRIWSCMSIISIKLARKIIS